MSTSLTPQERFWPKVEKTDTCWLWIGYIAETGYGNFRLDGKGVYPHRVAYEWTVGPIPAGLVIDHLCRVRHCVRPDHLEPVTSKENLLRGEGVGARNARKTHCKRGHQLAGENLRISMGRRVCRTCRRAREQA